MAAQPALDMIREGRRATTALHPLRRRILEALAEPDSAAGVARRIDLPRQKVNYHLRLLEEAALVELVEERTVGGLVERVFRTTARAYVITPEVLGPLAPDPATVQDRFSAAYLTAVASRTVRDLAELDAAARDAGKRLATFALDAEVRFSCPEDQHAFAAELVASVQGLVAKYHDDRSPGGRSFRFFVGGHPSRPAPAEAPPSTEED